MKFLNAPFNIFSNIVFEKESPINGKIFVVDDGLVRRLRIDGYTQSVSLDNRLKSNGYWDEFVSLTEELRPHPQSLLVLGMGAGTAIALFGYRFPEIKMVGVEIDPVVIEASNEMFDFEDLNFKQVIEDAYTVLDSSLKGEQFDLIIIDTYLGGDWVPKFEEKDYLTKVKSALNKNGLVMSNRIYSDDYKKELAQSQSLFQTIFGNGEILAMTGPNASRNVILYALNL